MFNPDNKVFHILCYFWTNNQKYEIGEKNKKHVATSLLVMASYLVGFNQKSKENSGHVTKQNIVALKIIKWPIVATTFWKYTFWKFTFRKYTFGISKVHLEYFSFSNFVRWENV